MTSPKVTYFYCCTTPGCGNLGKVKKCPKCGNNCALCGVKKVKAPMNQPTQKQKENAKKLYEEDMAELTRMQRERDKEEGII